MNGRMPVLFGKQVRYITGGRYRDKPESAIGIKMAAELALFCHIDIPTWDFEVPDIRLLKIGLAKTIWGLANGFNMYVGCLGGIGRTGLFLAALAKITGVLDPVGYVRATYLGIAVETPQQREYIYRLDVSDLKYIYQCAVKLCSGHRRSTAQRLLNEVQNYPW